MPRRATGAQLKTVLHLKSTSHFVILPFTHSISLCPHPPPLHPASVAICLLFCPPHTHTYTSLPNMKGLSGRTSHEAALAHAHTQSTHRAANE